MGLITAEEAARPKTEIYIRLKKFSNLLQLNKMVYIAYNLPQVYINCIRHFILLEL